MRNLSAQLKTLLQPASVLKSGTVQYGSVATGFTLIDDVSEKTVLVFGDGAARGDTVLYSGDRIVQVLGPADIAVRSV